jgi:CelD/BcsL family acetyltransferase involved in cellulose biosynthesis
VSAAPAELERRDEWRRLAVARGNPFVTPEWFACWLEHFGEEATPVIATLEGDGGVRGVLPMAIADAGRPRGARIAGSALGDRFHPACAPEDEVAVGEAAGRALAAAGAPWSLIALDRVDIDRPWVEALADATGVRLQRLRRSAGELPLIDLSAYAGWDAYLAGRSSNLRKRIGNLSRRAERDHAMTVRRTEDPSRVAADIGTLFELHARRFGRDSEIGERARAFHADFAAIALSQGWLRLWFLELEGEPAAAWYGWRLGDRYSFFNGGFDPRWSRQSPGFVLMAKVIESAFQEGAREFDFLLGDEGYKYRYADSSKQVHDVTLARAVPHPAAAAARADYTARNLGRRIPHSWRRRARLDRLGARSPLKRAAR